MFKTPCVKRCFHFDNQQDCWADGSQIFVNCRISGAERNVQVQMCMWAKLETSLHSSHRWLFSSLFWVSSIPIFEFKRFLFVSGYFVFCILGEDVHTVACASGFYPSRLSVVSAENTNTLPNTLDWDHKVVVLVKELIPESLEFRKNPDGKAGSVLVVDFLTPPPFPKVVGKSILVGPELIFFFFFRTTVL